MDPVYITYKDGRPLCPYCKNTMQQRGPAVHNGKVLVCKTCGRSKIIELDGRIRERAYSSSTTEEKVTSQPPRMSVDENKDTATISVITPVRIKTLDDLVKVCEIDTSIWDIERHIINKWEVGRKEISESMTYSTSAKGKTLKEGDKNDTGKIYVEPLFQVKAWLRKKTKEIMMREISQELIDKMNRYSPKYKAINYPALKQSQLLEIFLPDIHLGRLNWGLETGEDSDIKITRKDVLSTITEILTYAKSYSIKKILFPVGNDFFNVDNKNNTTAKGTPQQEDTRWRKTFNFGLDLLVECIDMLQVIAPVDVIVIPGNHDYERSFYLGTCLKSWYRLCPNVNIDNGPKTRKYYTFGKNLLGFTHGSSEKLSDLPLIMAAEVPEEWAGSKFRAWHTADKHHLKQFTTKDIEDVKGVTVRIAKSLASPDSWSYESGFINSVRGGEAYVWDETKGNVVVISANR